MGKKDPERAPDLAPGATKTIAVLREDLEVGKRAVETPVARIHKTVSEREEVVDAPLRVEEAHIERTPMHRYLEEPAVVREEGDAIIVPIMEEVLVVEKRLLLKEEVRITRRARTVHDPRRVILRSEEAVIEPLDPEK